jgi:multiple sugar transport system ATP-binding protein
MEVLLQGLSKHFGDVVAVDSLTVEVEDGSLVGLLGPSGCGKSTTLFMIAGLYKPTAGRIFFGKEDVTELRPERRGIGLVFQNYALYPHMTVIKNILFPLENQGIEKNKALDMAKEMADLVQIGDLLDRKPSALSGGQQQRVAIARALVKKPKVLLLDEPLSNLDARLRLETREEIRRIQKETGITTIYVTHDQEEAMSITDSILLMRDGVLQQKDDPQDMYNNPTNSFVAQFLGNPPINYFGGRAADNGVYIQDYRLTELRGVAEGDILVGVRPEGWQIETDGGIKSNITLVENIGRDKIVSFAINGEPARAIVDSDFVGAVGDPVVFRIKPGSYFLFDKDSGSRVAH